MISLPSFTFIPGWLYVPLFNWLIFFLMMTAVAQSASGKVYKWNASKETRILGILLVIFLILYIGLRPTISGYSVFADTFNYKKSLWALKLDRPISWLSTEPYLDKEWFFSCIQAFSAYYADEHLEFLIAASFYVGCSAIFCTRIFGNQWFIPFLMICSAFSFFSYGVNGVRNGMAASMVILSFSYHSKLWIAILLCILAAGVHTSILLLIGGAVLAWKVTNPKFYITSWMLCVLMVAIGGSTISTTLASSGIIADDRFSGYGIRQEGGGGYYTGFRADFLIYSSFPIISGAFFILKKSFKDSFYVWIYNIYIVANSFWILMMYASFSNRFAQLSWFLMPIVLIYPWFKCQFWNNQVVRLSLFLLASYAYTFYSSILVYF